MADSSSNAADDKMVLKFHFRVLIQRQSVLSRLTLEEIIRLPILLVIMNTLLKPLVHLQQVFRNRRKAEISWNRNWEFNFLENFFVRVLLGNHISIVSLFSENVIRWV